MLDFNAQNQVVGVEVLDLRRRVSDTIGVRALKPRDGSAFEKSGL